MTLGAGQQLSHYLLAEKIGSGGMGVVWKAEDTILHRTVAIKVLPADVELDDRRREKFLEEARLASSLTDSHIVQVYEFGRQENLDFIVMEYVDGQPLGNLLHGRALLPERVASLGLQVAQALSRAHWKGLLHRDLKPSNILITPDGEAKVADFGLATLFTRREGEPAAGGSVPPDLSAMIPTMETATLDSPGSGARVGTPPYMSPEQSRGERLDARSDIFSLGVVLYEMTTGQRPFAGSTTGELLAAIERANPRPVHDLVPKVPLDLDRIVHKALARRPSDRYQTMDDLAVDLRRLGQDLDLGSSPSYDELAGARAGRRPRRFLALTVGISLLLLTLGLAALVKLGHGFGTNLSDRTILILPLTVKGQEEGADYAGLAMAQALAVDLAQAPSLKLLPVPEEPVPEARWRPTARTLGAGRVLTGTVVREAGGMRASVNLLDTREDRIVWGTQMRIDTTDPSAAAAALAREALAAIGVSKPRMYEYIEDLAPGSEMSESPDFAAALAASRRSDYSALDEATARLIASFPAKPDAWVLRTWAKVEVWYSQPSPEHRAALQASFERLRNLDPANQYLKIFGGFVMNRDGKLPEAIAAFTEVLSRGDLAPGFRRWALKLRAECEMENQAFAASEADLKEAVKLGPGSAAVRSTLSRLYMQTKRYDEAVSYAKQAVDLEPNDFDNFMSLGLAYESLKQFAEAAAAYRKGIALNRSQFTLSVLARCLILDGKREEAGQVAAAAEVLPNEPYGCYNLACMWALAGDKAKALSFLRRSLDAGAYQPIDEDPDLASLQGEPQFKAIAAEIRKRLASK